MSKTTEIDLGEENPRQAKWNNKTLRLLSEYSKMPASIMFGKIGSGGMTLDDYIVLLAAAVHNCDPKISMKAVIDIIDDSDVNATGLALEASNRLLEDLISKNPIPPEVVTKMPTSTLPQGGKKGNKKKKSPGTASKGTPTGSE